MFLEVFAKTNVSPFPIFRDRVWQKVVLKAFKEQFLTDADPESFRDSTA